MMQITWFGHSAFRLDFAGKAVLIDPFFTGNPAFVSNRAAAIKGVSHILVTHGHSDHVGDTLSIVQETGAKVVTNFDLGMWLVKQGLTTLEPMNTGGTTQQDGFTVSLVRADHSAGQVESGVEFPLGSANGVIVKPTGQHALWHMGDTDIFSDMHLISEIHDVKVCICPIGDRFTMSPHTAAMAMKRFVTPQVAIPCHYGSFPIIEQTAEKFQHEMMGSGVKVIVPEKGKPFTV